MKSIMFESLTSDEIIDNLEAENCGVDENYQFLKPFTDDEMEERERSFLDLSKDLENKEMEKKELLAPIQEELNSLKKKTGNLRKDLARGGRQVTEKVYCFPDYENSLMGLYDTNGVLVGTRPMSRNERQLHINSYKHLKSS